jgi:hypothetical protein
MTEETAKGVAPGRVGERTEQLIQRLVSQACSTRRVLLGVDEVSQPSGGSN